MPRINGNGTVTMFTTAPRDYDYGWTTEIEAIAGTDSYSGKVYRRVEIDASRSDGQCMRYGSGLHAVVDSTEFAKRIDLGLVSIACGPTSCSGYSVACEGHDDEEGC